MFHSVLNFQPDLSLSFELCHRQMIAIDRGCVETQELHSHLSQWVNKLLHFVVLKIFSLKDDLTPPNRASNAVSGSNFTL